VASVGQALRVEARLQDDPGAFLKRVGHIPLAAAWDAILGESTWRIQGNAHPEEDDSEGKRQKEKGVGCGALEGVTDTLTALLALHVLHLNQNRSSRSHNIDDVYYLK